LILLAAAVTLLNAFKPILPDDAVYFLFAEHITLHPLDPYGFDLWDLQSANATLAPPVFLYWCAAGIRLFGPDPYWLKLWLLPIVLLFVFSLHALGRRFTDGLETLFVFVVVTSAAVLPCVNLMLDVPSLALGLASIAVFMRACDHRSVFEATVAGLIAGLAMETKYTAFTAPAAMLLYSLRVRRLRLGLLALVVAGGVFLAWEGFIAAKYGDSHFWLGAMQYSAPLSAKLRLVQPLFGCLGALVPFLLPMALAALGCSSRVVATVSGGLAISVAMLALPEGVWPSVITPKTSGIVFGLVGLTLLAAVAVVAVRLIRGFSTNAAPTPSKRMFSDDVFLIGWLVLELAGYFALSPYAAARRVMGLVVLLSLLTVRLPARDSRRRTKLLWMVAVLGTVHGLFLFMADDNWWRGRKELVSEAARVCRAENPKAAIWYFGDTAFDFYARRHRMQRLFLSDAIPASGDFVIVAEGFEDFFHRHAASSRCVESGAAERRSRLPVKSQFQASSVPIARWGSSRFRAQIYRVR
jgi:hypothetical protein